MQQWTASGGKVKVRQLRAIINLSTFSNFLFPSSFVLVNISTFYKFDLHFCAQKSFLKTENQLKNFT